MSESTPTEDDLVFAFANDNYFGPEPWRERDARRAIAKIKAEAWDEGYEACAHYHSLDTEHSAPNPYRLGSD